MFSKKKKTLIPWVLRIMTVSIFFLSSCVGKKSNSIPDESGELFKKSEQLIRLYIDSITTAKDSTSLINIINNFDSKITNLNYSFPPDTDLKMSEQENDSLIHLFKKLENAKQRQDSIIMKKFPKDSLSNNSENMLVVDSLK